LKRAIERHVVYPLANLLATDQVNLGDLVRIDWDESHDGLTLCAKARAPSTGRLAAGRRRWRSAVEAMDGKSAETRGKPR